MPFATLSRIGVTPPPCRSESRHPGVVLRGHHRSPGLARSSRPSPSLCGGGVVELVAGGAQAQPVGPFTANRTLDPLSPLQPPFRRIAVFARTGAGEVSGHERVEGVVTDLVSLPVPALLPSLSDMSGRPPRRECNDCRRVVRRAARLRAPDFPGRRDSRERVRAAYALAFDPGLPRGSHAHSLHHTKGAHSWPRQY